MLRPSALSSATEKLETQPKLGMEIIKKLKGFENLRENYFFRVTLTWEHFC